MQFKWNTCHFTLAFPQPCKLVLHFLQRYNKILCTYVYIHCRENIFFDCAHGLLVVLVSLLGFIGIVWLKDQLGHGLGPNWLEEDRREVNRVVMREAQERVDLLRRHLEEAGARARERHVLPDRVAVAAELTKLLDLLNTESDLLTDHMHRKFIVALKESWRREMEIVYGLFGSSVMHNELLKSARNKKYSKLQSKNQVNLFLTLLYVQ